MKNNKELNNKELILIIGGVRESCNPCICHFKDYYTDEERDEYIAGIIANIGVCWQICDNKDAVSYSCLRSNGRRVKY